MVKQSPETVQTYSKCVELIAGRTFAAVTLTNSSNCHSLASTPLNSTQIQPEAPRIVSNAVKRHETHPDQYEMS